MKCPEEIVEYMHDYLDDEISPEKERILKEHLLSCEDCRNHFHELKKALDFVQSPPSVTLSANFTDRVMASIQEEKKKKKSFKKWMMNHPLLSAASLFIVLMAGALLSTWNQGSEFSVSKQPNLVVNKNTVIVPRGETVKGDVVVRNGDIKIEGKVQGNVTVINGNKYLASAGSVTGNIEEVNQVFEWLWYKIKSGYKSTIHYFEAIPK